MAKVISDKNQDYRIIYLYKICLKIAVGNLRKMLHVRKYVIEDKKDTTIDCLCFSTFKELIYNSFYSGYFIQNLVRPDVEKDNTILFFKFPPKFKILLPKIIGNYNPDWAIVRKYNGEPKLELIRETKGGVKLDELRFLQEKRKILCAIKYFEKLGVNYRVVTSDSYDWMELEEPEQLSMEAVEQEQ